MKFLFASDSFKGSLTSDETIKLLTRAAGAVFPGCKFFRDVDVSGFRLLTAAKAQRRLS